MDRWTSFAATITPGLCQLKQPQLFFNSNSAEGLFTVFVSAHMPAHGLDGSFKTTLALCGSDTQCGAEGSAAGQLRRDRSGNAGTTTSLRARSYGGRTTLRATSPPGTEFRAVERVLAKNRCKSVHASQCDHGDSAEGTDNYTRTAYAKTGASGCAREPRGAK